MEQIKYYLRATKNKDNDNSYISIVDPIINDILETDIVVTEEINKYIMSVTTPVKVIKELPPVFSTLDEFKGYIDVEVINTNEEFKSPTMEALESLTLENAQLIKDGALKDIKIKTMEQDISDLMLMVSKVGLDPKIIQE